jgi:hypothetical protein
MLSIPIISEFDGKGIDKAIKQFKQLETAGEKAQFAIKKAAVPAAAALAGVAAAIGPAISAASDLEESMSKVNVIFGDGAKAVEDFSKTAAKSMGQSAASVLQAAGTFGTFGKAAGLSGADLANFSNQFTTLASDLASFNNTTPEEAINAIGSALRGEAEPMRKFGVLLNDATLKAEAMALGIYSGSGALTDQQKILAAQSAIYKQTGDAQGDFERTSDGLANTSRILAAQMENLQGSIGKGLLPVVQAVLPVVQKFADWATKNPQAFLAIAGAITAISVAILAVNFAMALNPFTAIAAGVAALVVGIVYAYNKFETFRTIVNSVLNGLISGFETFANAYITAINMIIRGMNLINPFSDIASLPTISLPSIGGGGGGGDFAGTSERAGMPQVSATMPAMPAPAAPLAITGGGGGSGSSASSFGDQSGRGGGFFGDSSQAMASSIYNIYVSGVMSNAQTGEEIVNNIRAYNRAAGPANIAVA